MQPNYLQIRKLSEAVSSAKKPVILAGAGILHAKATGRIKSNMLNNNRFLLFIHLLGLGGFPADHELFVGLGGMHGCYAANMALYECDFLLNIGARFDDRLTGNLNILLRMLQ